MADIFAEAIARTAGPCEGPHDHSGGVVVQAEWRVCFFIPSYCGGEDCKPTREMVTGAGMSLCQNCLDRCQAKTGVMLHIELGKGASLEFIDSKVA